MIVVVHGHTLSTASDPLSNSALRKAAMAALDVLAEDPAFMQRKQVGLDSIDNRPRVALLDEHTAMVVPYHESRVPWKGALRNIPFSDEEEGVDEVTTRTMNGIQVLVIQGDPVDQALMQAYRVKGHYMSQVHNPRYDIYGGNGEEYDDEAEVLAQLDIGREYGASISILDPSGPELGREGIKVRWSRSGPQTLEGKLVPRFPSVTEGGEVIVSYQFRLTEGKASDLTAEQKEMLGRLINCRNIISQYGSVHPQTGKLWLPYGWSDQETPEFVAKGDPIL